MAYRTMADGIGGTARDPQAIRDRFGPDVLVAGYLDGAWAWTPAQWNLFDADRRVYVTTVQGSAESMRADVADCENGDYDPAHAAAWAHARKRLGYDRPTIYCNRSNIAAVRQATGTLILGKDYDIWVADWTGAPHEVPGCAATQYASDADWDLTAVYDPGWPHRTTAPRPQDDWTEKMIANLPTLAEGPNTADVFLVFRIQGLCVAVGKHHNVAPAKDLAIDGAFGPDTKAAVQAVQKFYGLTEDGIVGQQTWTALITG